MRILILANNDVGLYKFRKELIGELLVPGSFLKGRTAQPCEVFISLPKGEYVPALEEMGCKFFDTPMDRHGTDPAEELKLLRHYRRLLRQLRPDIVLSYTIKPNIYGAMACRSLKIPCIMNITGLGTAVENGGLMQKLMLLLYRAALPGAKTVFFQNERNKRFFAEKKLALGKHKMVPGSGVNLDHYQLLPYPQTEKTEFVFIGRIMKDKGIEHYLEAARHVRRKHPNTVFHICGPAEADYRGRLQECIDDGTVVYHGPVSDVRKIHEVTHCVIHPSYHEGMSNVLLEAAACGRPVLASAIPGCQETFDEGISGFGFEAQNTDALIACIERFLNLSLAEREQMGRAGRNKVGQEFDRNMVLSAYLEEIDKYVER